LDDGEENQGDDGEREERCDEGYCGFGFAVVRIVVVLVLDAGTVVGRKVLD